ncbi:MAG: ATP-dependent zinc metalloprotease FtsH [Gemmiger sp.]|uniref:ATP-dependent zinc metalloprotease FtsH n=1 Tax=Gemmiger sp. TaxID=2049027 RepID=UPI002A7FCA5B|nr:ATP-dependent zinc metalloprotease FtsH [Gemmiger sp.]MCI6248747.1 ATP-dependent zinc metalloprotease FtsH [bacterium]MCI6883565.1 ATP-dependent zinc metalloprotease FtsH [bacterium]MCI7193276.1 ATP-dependent zinc metalloprotease FtsH [bacterium]MDD5858587.1 ATP-dependent zinc metalloprotease FtsH [bacterium]MDD6717125.1 ATP-dependent zinc metalloprotease FtsH [bacterium]
MQETKQPKDPKKVLWGTYLVIFAVVMLLNLWLFPKMVENRIEQVDYGTFLTMLEEGRLSTVEIEDQQIYFVDKDNVPYKTNSIPQDLDIVNRLKDAGVTFGKVYQQTSILDTILGWIITLLPMIILMVLLNRMMRSQMQKMSGGPNSMLFGGGKSGAKQYVVQEGTAIKFADVAGEDEAKESLQEIVDFLHSPRKYEEVGAKMPKGVLLVGPPGTGKTLLARAVAGEAGVPFFSIAGSEFVEMFVGMGASKVRDLFKQANEKAPCIVFIDEIDTIGKKRDGAAGMGGNDEREQTLNQLLTEMDGFDAAKGVIILAATNRPESLDPALTRPGRFDRRVPVELPDLKGRESILRLHAQKVKVGPDCDFANVARMTPGASGAELANIVNEAALSAVRHNRRAVTQYDLQEAVDTILAGAQKKNKILTDKEKCIVAYHEVGHAMVAAMQTHTAPVQKITIVPRTSGALGFTMQVEDGDHTLLTKEEILAKIATFTGGRAAEEVVFGSITTGASNDIEQATKLARAMITRYGMSDDFDMVALETVNNAYLGGDASLACSERTAATVDDKVVEVVRAQHEKARQILVDNRAKLDEISKYLYEKETITGEEFMRILNAKPQLTA